MQTEKVYFLNSRGENICGILEKPTKNKDRIVIVVHGYSTHKNRTSSLLMVEELTTHNINSLRIDLSGCGESEGDFTKQSITSSADDILTAINYAKNLGYVDVELFGASAGGLAAMVAALSNPDVKRLGLKCPVSDFVALYQKRLGTEGLEKWRTLGTYPYVTDSGQTYHIDYSVFDDYTKHIMYDQTKSIQCPILIVHGDADDTVPVDQSKELVTCFPNAKLVIIPGADHKFTNTDHRIKMTQLFGDWFKA